MRSHITVFLIGLSSVLFAQVEFGFQAGVNTLYMEADPILVNTNLNNAEISFEESVALGYHFGIFLQMQKNIFFAQPSVWFSSTQANFTVTDANFEESLEEQYRKLDIPVLLGFKFGPIRLGAGPKASIFINHTSGIETSQIITNYNPNFSNLDIGYIAGLGIDIWNFHIDLNYESQFQKLGNHMDIDGRSFGFDSDVVRLLGTIGITF